MATTTPNFGWPVPTSTDLVKDGAVAIEGLGDAIDASLLDLKGGTTGQVLKKNTNADMDFVWSADSAGMTNPMTTTGDTIYSSSGSTPARLGIGSTGQVLTVAGGVPSWATPAGGGGKVLQVVNAFDSSSPSTTSGTLADAGLTATITPTSSTSKILVIVNQYFARASNSSAVGIQLLRGSTSILQAEAQMMNVYTTVEADCMFAANILDSPATTSATTYKTQFRSTGGGTIYASGYSFSSTITLLEIGA